MKRNHRGRLPFPEKGWRRRKKHESAESMPRGIVEPKFNQEIKPQEDVSIHSMVQSVQMKGDLVPKKLIA